MYDKVDCNEREKYVITSLFRASLGRCKLGNSVITEGTLEQWINKVVSFSLKKLTSRVEPRVKSVPMPF